MSIKLAIIAAILAVSALGVSAFATFEAVNQDSTPPAAERQWSETECEEAKETVFGGKTPAGTPYAGILERGCMREGNCTAFNDMLQAIADNCP